MVFDLQRALRKRNGTGMPGPLQVKKQFARWKKILAWCWEMEAVSY